MIPLQLVLACSPRVPPRAHPDAPPGAAPRPRAVRSALAEAVAALPPDYQPRTRHVDDHGAALWSNRLLLEASPYLRQHAHNPVDWFPWGDEAFELAHELGRPLLVSVGYATCHWCHVMEEESFEDPEIGRFLNEHYIAVKVDREERPDVDALTMAAVQAIRGDGGWPTTVWMTPDGQPFYAGTYFPARDGDRGARVGFLTIATQIADAWQARRADIEGDASRLTAELTRRLETRTQKEIDQALALDYGLAHFVGIADPVAGGPRGAPKFPSSLPPGLLLRAGLQRGDDRLVSIATQALEGMAAGGIHDQLGGGFHRYSTDDRWRVPHFEKMLYDNALLAVTYAEAGAALDRPDLSAVALDTLSWMDRELSVSGGFASALDADSLAPGGERVEGWCYTWTPEELDALLPPDQAAAGRLRWGLDGEVELEGRHVLYRARPVAEVAAALGRTEDETRALLDAARQTLLDARDQRPQPLRDDKIVAEWNGLAIAAFARGGVLLDRPDLVHRAETAADAVLTLLVDDDGRLHRSWRSGVRGPDAVLEDHAGMMWGLITLFEATGQPRWLRAAIRLDEQVQAHFELDAAQGGGWARTAEDHDRRLPRARPRDDGAFPSGPSLMVASLLRLHALTLDDRYRQRADAGIDSLGQVLEKAPWALSDMLTSLWWRQANPREVVLSWPDGADAAPMRDVLRRHALQARVEIPVADSQLAAVAAVAPVVEGKHPRDDKPTAYVCTLGVCQAPVTDPAALDALL
ncbi:MAG: thioredoxin domain-containing protein, partial [Deltaproteobacteria bacterium]